MQNNMQNTTQIDANIKKSTISPDILVISRTMLPKEGGIEEYVYNRCLQDPDRVIVLTNGCPGDNSFDENQIFPIYRWQFPKYLNIGFLGSILKQIIYMFWELVLAIKLYFRYRYRYIEWGHGYDFPVLLLLKYILPVRCLIYLHGNDILCPLRNRLLRLLFQFTLNRMSKIACNSTFTAEYLKSHFHLHIPIQVINPVVRPEKFGVLIDEKTLNDLRSRVRNIYKIPEKSVVILSVGRLVPRKGFDKVIEIIPKLLSECLDVHYIVCGRGVMEPELKSLANRLGVMDRVHFVGYVPDKELAGYYAACDLFAMLTFFDSKASSIEGFGIVYVEAGYFSKPVIASRVGGVTDAVSHGENGILVEPNSGDEILQAFRCLCHDENLRSSLGRRGYEFAGRKTLHQTLYFGS